MADHSFWLVPDGSVLLFKDASLLFGAISQSVLSVVCSAGWAWSCHNSSSTSSHAHSPAHGQRHGSSPRATQCIQVLSPLLTMHMSQMTTLQLSPFKCESVAHNEVFNCGYSFLKLSAPQWFCWGRPLCLIYQVFWNCVEWKVSSTAKK